MTSKEYIDLSIKTLTNLQKNTWFIEYAQQNKERFTRDLELIESLMPSRNAVIADLGAAPFILPYALMQKGYDVHSYDIAPNRFSHLESLDLKLVQVDLDNWSNHQENVYDLVIFTEVFEHLRGDLINVMTSINTSLKKDGLVYITTPNFRSITGLYKLIFKKISYACSRDIYEEWDKLAQIGHMGHVREYTLQELVVFSQKCGFDVVHASTKPMRLGSGFKNDLLYATERLFNPLNMGGSSKLILRKN